MRTVAPKNFFAELKRRNVYRAAVAYGVVPWFLTQLTTQVFPFFEIPNSAVRFVVIALAVGFPIAMLLSWLYVFTFPIKHSDITADVRPGESERHYLVLADEYSVDVPPPPSPSKIVRNVSVNFS